MTNTPTRPETMVERVARAIHDASHKELGFSWAKEMRMAQARAAIEAMRDLPDAMKWCHEMPDIGPDEIAELWQAMITAALGDG